MSAHFSSALLAQNDGGAQNDNAVKLDSVDRQTDDAKTKCLHQCMKYQSQTDKIVTGCEFVWDQSDGGCYGEFAEGRVSSRCMNVLREVLMTNVSVCQSTPETSIPATGLSDTRVGFFASAPKQLH